MVALTLEKSRTEPRDTPNQTPPFARRHPYLFVTLLVVLFVGVDLPMEALGSSVVLPYLILAIIAAALVTKQREWRRMGFALTGTGRRSVLLFAPVFLLSLWYVTLAPMMGYGTVAIPPLGGIALLASVALLIGFVEEVYFRGMMLQALESKGLWTAVLVTAFLFGPVHLENAFLGAAPLSVILQVVYATALGLSFASLVFATGLIWPLILAHALLDFFPSLNSAALNSTAVAPADYAMTALIVAFFVPYSFLLLRRANRVAPGRLETAAPLVAARD